MASAVAAPARGMTSLRTKLFYGLGSVAFGVKDNGFQTILLPFYNLVLHVPAHLVGLAIFIALAFDALIDPVVGHISDNFRSRWGRRHPFMYAAALPVAISYLLLWNPPHWSSGALFIYLIVVAVVVRTFITFYEIPSSALVPELTSDYDERTSFIGYRVFLGWYGALVMLTLAYLVFMGAGAAGGGGCGRMGQLHAEGYSLYGITAAVVMFSAIVVSALGTHRFIPYFRKPERIFHSLRGYAKAMLQSLSNRAFLILLAAAIFFQLANGLVFSLTFYINTFFWKLSNQQIGIVNLALFVSLILAFAMALPLSKRLGKKAAAIAMFAIGFVINSTPLMLALLGVIVPHPGPALVAFLFCFTTIGSGFAIGSSIMIVSMVADIVEDNEIKTGNRSEGLFFAGNSFIQKASSGLGLFASGIMLTAVGFPTDTTPCSVDPHIVLRFSWTYIVTIAAIYGLGFLIISRFPITRASHEENLRTLAREVGEGLIDEPPAPMI